MEHRPYRVRARVFAAGAATTVTGRAPTRGHVGVALSGGGTRSAAASMGALRVLHALGLLRHVRAISSVSGGSWFAVPFTFLPEQFDEEAFLGRHVADPGALRWSWGDEPTDLCSLQAGNFGEPLSSIGMSAAGLAIEALRDRMDGVVGERLWSRQIGDQLLARFDLARFDARGLPDDFFAADAAAAAAIRAANPDLPQRCHLVRVSATMPRPHLIVGAGMRVRGRDGADTLAPVVFTPHVAGIPGTGIGTLDGREVGGGVVSSFAFGGRWVAGDHERAELELAAPLALSDMAGISSASFADSLSDRAMHGVTPALTYFSPRWPSPAGATARFVDGGSLENTGVAQLVAHEDIDAIVAIVNAPRPVELEGDEVVVDRQVAALFGYREWNRAHGFRRYSEPGEGNPDYGYSQVFAADDGQFQDLLEGIGACHRAGEPIVVARTHEVVRNDRFAVAGGRSVKVLWVLQSPARQWVDRLHPLVRLALGPNFPNIPTAFTSLAAGHVSLLAQFTGWMLSERADAVRALFGPG